MAQCPQGCAAQAGQYPLRVRGAEVGRGAGRARSQHAAGCTQQWGADVRLHVPARRPQLRLSVNSPAGKSFHPRSATSPPLVLFTPALTPFWASVFGATPSHAQGLCTAGGGSRASCTHTRALAQQAVPRSPTVEPRLEAPTLPTPVPPHSLSAEALGCRFPLCGAWDSGSGSTSTQQA